MVRWLSVVLAIAAAGIWACEVTTPGLDDAVPANTTCGLDAGEAGAPDTSLGPGPNCTTAP